MGTKTIIYNEHKIEIKTSMLTGKETILYDGKEVSSKRTLTGSTHIFQVNENGEDVQYEVEIGLRWHGLSGWFTVRRNGKIIYSDR